MVKKENIETQNKILWWQNLNSIWRKALNVAYLNQANDYSPSEEELEDIFSCKVLRLVGPGGPNSNMDERLQNLSVLKCLHNLETIILTYHSIKTLEGIEGCKALRTLFIHNNDIDDLSPLKNLINLEELYCQSNNIESLIPLKNLVKLKVLVCDHNQLSGFAGISEKHTALKNVYALPNEGVGPKQVRELEDFNIFCK